MGNKALTLTIVANMTANYGESLGNISSTQKIYKSGRVYAIRSRESIKNAIMVQSGLYDDLETKVDAKQKKSETESDNSKSKKDGTLAQKVATDEKNVSNCRALEGGYMTTGKNTYIRKSSFYLTDAIAVDSFVNESRFHNNLYLAGNYAKANDINLQSEASGLMLFQYEYDKSLKIYSITIDMDMIGKEINFGAPEADNTEKAYRVNALITAVENLSLVVKGNLDNAEPIFVIGGLSDRKTHIFENAVRVKNCALDITEDLKNKLSKGFSCGLMKSDIFSNDDAIISELGAKSVSEFFDNLRLQVNNYYGV